MSWLQLHKEGWVIALKVSAGARETTLIPMRSTKDPDSLLPTDNSDSLNKLIEGDWIKMRVHAAPEKGKANEEIIRWFSKALGLRQDQITILTGHTQSHKKLLLVIADPEPLKQLISTSLLRPKQVTKSQLKGSK